MVCFLFFKCLNLIFISLILDSLMPELVAIETVPPVPSKPQSPSPCQPLNISPSSAPNQTNSSPDDVVKSPISSINVITEKHTKFIESIIEDLQEFAPTVATESLSTTIVRLALLRQYRRIQLELINHNDTVPLSEEAERILATVNGNSSCQRLLPLPNWQDLYEIVCEAMRKKIDIHMMDLLREIFRTLDQFVGIPPSEDGKNLPKILTTFLFSNSLKMLNY